VVAVNLADDERARVPFALVGVVLLVASAATAGMLATRDPVVAETRGDRAVERAQTGASVALASASRSALEATARNPVVSPANTTFGAALDPDSPVLDALALRVYDRTEQALRSQTSSVGGVTANASLPRIETTADAERATEAVRVTAVNDSLVRVTLADVSVDLRRDGKVVARSETNVTATVHSSALALHDRVSRFETLLDRDAMDGPGLDRRLTGLLHGVVGVRGMLQYGGLPIANVLANRHVELATNRAVLSMQDAAFGRSDGAGEAAYHRARAQVGIRDVVAVAQRDATSRAKSVLAKHGVPETAASVGVSTGRKLAKASDPTVPVGVNVSADRAFVSFADGAGETSLQGTLSDAYATSVRRAVDTETISETTSQTGRPPEGWTLRETDTSDTVRVTDASPASDALQGDSSHLESYGRRVVVVERTTSTYANGTRERTIVETERAEYRVTVSLGYELRPPPRGRPSDRTERVLDRPVRGGVGPGLRERIAECATSVFLEDGASVDALAKRAVDESVTTRVRTVHPEIPQPVRDRAYRTAATLRERARNVSENVSTGDLAAGEVPIEALRSRLDALNDPSASYDSVEARAVAAVRETYLGRVDARIRDRRADGTLADVGAEFGDRGVESPPDGRAERAASSQVVGVDAAPAYLTLGKVGSDVSAAVDESYHPMAARNVNWFTIPHGDAASAVLDEVLDDPPESVRLGTAAQALAAANNALNDVENESLRSRRKELRDATRDGVESAGRGYRGLLAASNVSFTERERHRITDAAFGRWSPLAARAKAIANGSAADAVVAAAARVGDLSAIQRDRLATRFRAEGPDVHDRSAVRVPADLVKSATKSASRVSRVVAAETLSEAGAIAGEKAAKRLGASKLGAVPAGFPVVPVPGFWYATANAWSVSAKGSWASFSVHARGGSPLGEGNGTTYVREDTPVTFDVDGDGRTEHVGRNERLSFDVSATVVVVVPAGPRGVGDVNGEADEQSDGW
jgi:hypothetical protein